MTDTSRKVDGHAYFIRKPSSYLEVMQSTLSKHFHLFDKPKPFSIVRIIELYNKDYKTFTDSEILHDHDFLKQHTDCCYVNEHGIWQAIKVVNKDNPEETILVQTEGASYARYVALETYYPEKLKDSIDNYPLKEQRKYTDKLKNVIKERGDENR